MEALTVTVEPATTAVRRPGRRPARRQVTKRVEVPSPAPLWAQIVGLLVLLALCGGSIYTLANADSTGAQLAAGAVLVLAAFVLVVWAAAALGTGLGPKQLIGVLKAFFEAFKDAGKAGDDTADPPVDSPEGEAQRGDRERIER